MVGGGSRTSCTDVVSELRANEIDHVVNKGHTLNEMKIRPKAFVFAPLGVVLASCNGGLLDQVHQPLPGGGNALDPPGYQESKPLEIVEPTGPTYSSGQWVETSVSSAAIYERFPKTGDQPVQTLAQGTPLKVVSTQGTYAKVEMESGAIGYVPTIMIAEKASPNEIPIVPTGPTDVLPGPSYDGFAPEPEVAPISVETLDGLPPSFDQIDPTLDDIE